MELTPLRPGQTRKVLHEWKSDEDGSERVLSIIESQHCPTIELHLLVDGKTYYEHLDLLQDEWERVGREMGWLK